MESTRSMRGRRLGPNEELLEYKYVEMPDGETFKRKKVIKRTTKRMLFLTIEQKEEIDNAFSLFDKDRSGTIDVNELKDAMKALGIFLRKKEVRVVMTKVDKDGSGAIDKDEFMSLMAEQIVNRNQEEELKKVFKIYDDDDKGLITSNNLLKCAKDLGEEMEIKPSILKKAIKIAQKSRFTDTKADHEDLTDILETVGRTI